MCVCGGWGACNRRRNKKSYQIERETKEREGEGESEREQRGVAIVWESDRGSPSAYSGVRG